MLFEVEHQITNLTDHFIHQAVKNLKNDQSAN